MALRAAAKQGDVREVVRLLDLGSDANEASELGDTALQLAAAFGHTRVVRTLLAAGASPLLAELTGLLPLHLASARNHLAAARLLLEAAPETATAVAFQGITACFVAAEQGHPALVRLLLSAAPRTAMMQTEGGSVPLHVAAQEGRDAVVRVLLAAAPAAALERRQADGATPLHLACSNGHTGVVRQLLTVAPQAAGVLAGLQTQGTALMAAVQHGYVEIVQLILEAAPDVALVRGSSTEPLPIHYAAGAVDEASSAPMVQALLAIAPATAAATYHAAFTPLHLAAAQGNAEAARLLVQAAPETLAMRASSTQVTPLEAALTMAAGAALEAAQPDLFAAVHPEGVPKPLSAYLNTARPMLAAMPPELSLPVLVASGGLAARLFPEVAAHWPLTAAQWAQVPGPCPGIGKALPAVLQRAAAEAALLVARLPAADSKRLRTFALALHRSQRRLGVFLPAELGGRILSLFDA